MIPKTPAEVTALLLALQVNANTVFTMVSAPHDIVIVAKLTGGQIWTIGATSTYIAN